MVDQYDRILSVARQAAETAGTYLLSRLSTNTAVEYKGEIDLVTESDRESQRIIHQILTRDFPDHSILGEENLKVEKNNERLWLIDPIDGTTNYARSLPAFCISIAYMEQAMVRAGVVYAPVLGEMFYASLGHGSFLNGKKICVSKMGELRRALLATGFPYDRRRAKDNNVDHFNKFIVRALGIRRMGSAAIDLCYTAAGRFDGFWEIKLKPWDTAAGAIIVQEAGGVITDFNGDPFDPFKPECLATNGLIHEEMTHVIAGSFPSR